MGDADDFDALAMFGGRYLTGPNLPTDGRTLTIAGAGVEDVEDPKTKAVKERLVVYFNERVKPWLPCRTTAECLRAIFGTKMTGGWRGRQVTLYHDTTVKVGSAVRGGIRVLGAPSLTEPMDLVVNLGARKPPAKVRLIPTGDPLAVALAELEASEAALATYLSTLPQPATLPTDRVARAGWAQRLRRAAPDSAVLAAIRGTAPRPTADTQPDPTNATTNEDPAEVPGEE